MSHSSRDIIRVLVVEDSLVQARLLLSSLAEAEPEGFELIRVDRLSACLDRLSRGGIDVVLLDLFLPDSSGIETFVRAHDHSPEVPIVMLTGVDVESVAIDAMRRGAQDYLIKGRVDGQLVARAIRYAIERKLALQERERLIVDLQVALAKIKTMSGMLPICSSCKKICDDQGYWSQIESYVSEHSEAEFSHSICPGCFSNLYPDRVSVGTNAGPD